MTTIIRRYRRQWHAPAFTAIAAIVLGLVLAGIFMVIWAKGGPQPLHEIVIAIPAPAIPPAAGLRA